MIFSVAIFSLNVATHLPRGDLMNIDQLTIAQAREIAAMFPTNAPATSLASELVGQYVIVRSRNEGINAGFVVRADHTGIVLKDARRIWYHKPADKGMAWYEGVAISGLSDDSKLSAAVPLKAIIEDYSITVCTDVASESIQQAKAHEQR